MSGKYGRRYCKICHLLEDAEYFGRHVLIEHVEEMDRWPGGSKAFISDLRESIEKSLAKAQDDPAAKAGFQQTLRALKAVEASLNE